MPDLAFDDLPVLGELAAELNEAMRSSRGTRRRRWWRRMSPRALSVAVAIAVPAAGASAAGTLYVLRGDVIPAPAAAPAEQTPRPGTSRLVALRAADPAGGRPRWALRLAISQTGLLCSTVGEMVGDRFGVVGLDRHFRVLSEGAVDSCSVRRDNAASLVGARIFTAARAGEVRTIVYGVGGAMLRDVRVEARGATRRLGVGAGGTFIAAYAGLPEDLGLRVALRFADGHVERHDFGVGPAVFADPGSGRAWRVQNAMIGGDDRTCITVVSARERVNAAISPAACGRLTRGPRRPRGLFFAVRRLIPGTGGIPVSPFGAGRWGRTRPRLLIWGAAGADVAAIDVRGPAGQTATHTWFRPNGAFAYMFGRAVRPDQVRVVVRFRDGRRLEQSGSYGLVTPPRLGKGP